MGVGGWGGGAWEGFVTPTPPPPFSYAYMLQIQCQRPNSAKNRVKALGNTGRSRISLCEAWRFDSTNVGTVEHVSKEKKRKGGGGVEGGRKKTIMYTGKKDCIFMAIILIEIFRQPSKSNNIGCDPSDPTNPMYPFLFAEFFTSTCNSNSRVSIILYTVTPGHFFIARVIGTH